MTINPNYYQNYLCYYESLQTLIIHRGLVGEIKRYIIDNSSFTALYEGLYSVNLDKYCIKYLIIYEDTNYKFINSPNTLTHLIFSQSSHFEETFYPFLENIECIIWNSTYYPKINLVMKKLAIIGFRKDYDFPTYNIPESVHTLIFFSTTFNFIKKSIIPIWIKTIKVYGDVKQNFIQTVKIPWGCKIESITNCTWG